MSLPLLAAPCRNFLTNAANVSLISAIRKPLESRAQRDESSNFSDTTNADLLNAAIGIENVVMGKTAKGKSASTSLMNLLSKSSPTLAKQLESKLPELRKSLGTPVQPFDQMIQGKNAASRSQLERVAMLAEEQATLFQQIGVVLGS